ncbi:hypothetical protein LDENG_00039390 [Lucifuga dentata]|nr:hypothetical protein LDENG_00039390 [Lucifuga dentata]
MEGRATILLSAVLAAASAQGNFYGESINFMPLQKNVDGTVQVSFHHRQNGKSSCQNHVSYSCDDSTCRNFNQYTDMETDTDNTGRGRWCQTEGLTTATVSPNKQFFNLRDSGCCWVSNINGKTNWRTYAQVDLGTRSDTRSLNNCPVTATVASLRAHQNCFSALRLLAFDPDGDHVRCRFATDVKVPSNINLVENECTLRSTGQMSIGVHVFELVLEDHAKDSIMLIYANETVSLREPFKSSPLCTVTLQFALEILPPLANCEAGHVQPQFLSAMPSHGDLQYAAVGQKFLLYIQAQADHSIIHEFQISGPQNMTKEFKDDTFGKADVTVSWTPQLRDLNRYVPLCFTAETIESQSEMHCIVVLVTNSPAIKGRSSVTCSANQMTVALEKASMPGIDENWLHLRDETCSFTSNDTHILATMSFSTCGTKLEDKGDFVVFSNEIRSFELPTEIITRRGKVAFSFSCQFAKSISISNSYNIHSSDYIFTESSFGSFSYTFDIFSDGSFTTKVEPTAYPVEVKLMEMIYMGIQAHSELPNVTLFVESCRATPDENPKNSLYYDLISHGCMMDETMKVHSSDQDSLKFEIQAFKFTGNHDQLYITCSVILCEAQNPVSRCAQGCLNNASRRRRRGLFKETASHNITQGPFQFIRHDHPNTGLIPKDSQPNADTKARNGFQEMLGSNIFTIVFASLFVVAVLMLALTVRYFAKRRRADDNIFLLD